MGKGRGIKRREKSTPQRLQFPFAAHFRNLEKRFWVEVFVPLLVDCGGEKDKLFAEM